ncbi:diaminopimelate epimerase [Aeromicrobium sp. PE09-221]|uniref:diaminopimelate epimerase n=1 Tax=Aeromicrobium sp. PE09-221 TaxID=1898043 RepID=UPI000B3EDA0A|nr:diaminopimelate epimerase [Aeromicrobium sp. PE09-221]OUZ09945.1 diaminopimelate epimerase [Aeromicrobium sp. PE09-221]
MTFSWQKGHGTENDFVLLPDHDGAVHGDLDPAFVAALCHRRRGIGADGVLRVIRSAAAGVASEAEWFMDYRNADGSVSEMCGNGVRVFARHLLDGHLVDTDRFAVATRDGDKFVTIGEDGQITVDMGSFNIGGCSEIRTSEGLTVSAREVNTGNPHAVAFVEDVEQAGTLLTEPHFDREVYPDGVNIEFVARRGPGHVRMRVHERGSGETRSCGTGACAVGIASALVDGVTARPAEYRVDVPGGTVYVTLEENDHVVLTGPAEIVARGEMEWMA